MTEVENSYARLLLSFLLALFGLFLAWGAAAGSSGVDFYQFWVVAQTYDRPGINIYSNEDRSSLGAEFLQKSRETGNPRLIAIAEYRQKLETYSSPFLYVTFRPFATGHYETDLRNYRLLLLACFTFSIVVLSRLLNHPWDITAAAVAVFSGWFAPFSSDMRVGNVNSVQLAVLTIYLVIVFQSRWRFRDIVGGAILGLAVAFKPNLVFVPLMLAISWIARGRMHRLIQQAIATVAGAIIAIVVTGVSFGSLRCWTNWISAVRALPSEIISVDYGNFAPGRMLSDWLGVDVMFFVAIIFGGIALGAIWRSRRGVGAANDTRSDLIAVCLGCLLLVLLPRLAWLHYYVLMVPVVLVLLSSIASSPGRQHSVIARYVLLGLAVLAYAFDLLGRITVMPPPKVQAILVLFSALLLFVLTVSRLSQSRLPHA